MAKKKSTKGAKSSTGRPAKKKVASSKSSAEAKKPAAKKAAKKSKAEQIQPKKGFEAKASRAASKARSEYLKQTASDEQRVSDEMDARWDELCRQRIEAEAALAEWWPELQRLSWVTGSHVGLKRVKGKFAFPLCYCIRVHVTKKLSEKDLPPSMRLPDYYHGIDVDLWEANYRSLAGGTLPDRHESVLMGGIAIAPQSNPGNWGTLGFCVKSNGKPMLLTNHHVAGGVNNVLIQPPSQNVPSGSPVVGTVIRAIRDGGIDASLIQPDGSRGTDGAIRVGNSILPGIFEEGLLTSADTDPRSRARVFKIGAASGGSPQQTGFVKSITGNPSVPGIGALSNQIMVDFVSRQVTGGDSGSMLIKQEVRNGTTINKVVGLVVAEINGGLGLVANHFSSVRDRLGIQLN